MTPKEYLSQISILNTKINHKLDEIQRLKADAVTISSIELRTDKVKSGGCASDARFVNAIAKIDSLEREVENETVELSELRHKIINEIHSVNDVRFEELLYKRYVENKDLYDIAKEMHFSYIHTRRLHGYALFDFGEKILKDDTQRYIDPC